MIKSKLLENIGHLRRLDTFLDDYAPNGYDDRECIAFMKSMAKTMKRNNREALDEIKE
jgi:hypothetical protein